MPINVSEQIEEAMERGEFRNLPGKGKPLKLDTNPFLTPQARMANRLLKENGFAPRWIELEKEIKQEKAQLERLLTNLKARRERLATLIAQHPHRHEAVSRSFEYELARGIAQYSEKLENLNRKIQRVNLLMPTRNRQYALINKEAALTRFQKACPSL
jgi:DnaJ family protein C protein 28